MAKILLVEDDNNLREIYEARLQAEGYEIVSAMDGEEALVVAKKEKPELIISDVMMPRISGFEMLDILRNTAGLKEVKVIMLTALGQAEDKTRADTLGADRYLVKSQVTLEDIVKAAQELLSPASSAPGVAAPAASTPTAPPATPTASAASSSPAPAVAASAPVAVTPAPAIPVAAPPAAIPAPTAQPAPTPVATPTVITPPLPTPPGPKPSETPPAGVPTPTNPPVPPTVNPPSPNPTPPPVPATRQPATMPAAATPTASAPSAPAATTGTAPLLGAAPAPTPAASQPATPPKSSVDDIMADAIKNLVSESETADKPEPAKEPVVEPLPATASAPEPTPTAPAPSATPTATAADKPVAPGDAQSVSDEEAAIQAQIDKFVTQDNEPAPTAPTTPGATSAPTVSEPSADTTPSETTTAPPPLTISPSETPAEPAAAVSAPAEKPTGPTPAAAETKPDNDEVAIAHKKVISPISTSAVAPTGLDELLAKEGFNSDFSSTHPAAVPVAVVSAPAEPAAPTPAPPQTGATGLPTTPHPPGHVITPNKTPGVDPSSIAL